MYLHMDFMVHGTHPGELTLGFIDDIGYGVKGRIALESGTTNLKYMLAKAEQTKIRTVEKETWRPVRKVEIRPHPFHTKQDHQHRSHDHN